MIFRGKQIIKKENMITIINGACLAKGSSAAARPFNRLRLVRPLSRARCTAKKRGLSRHDCKPGLCPRLCTTEAFRTAVSAETTIEKVRRRFAKSQHVHCRDAHRRSGIDGNLCEGLKVCSLLMYHASRGHKMTLHVPEEKGFVHDQPM